MGIKTIFRFIGILPVCMRKRLVAGTVDRFLKKNARITVEGLENIPGSENVIFVSNHLSNADGLIYHEILNVSREHGKTFFVAGVKLKGDTVTNMVLDIIPHVSIKPGEPDKNAIRSAISILKEGNSIFVFPEGTRSRTGALIRGRSGAVLIARKSRVKVVPLALTGSEKLLPIDEEGKMGEEKFAKADVRVKIGKPIDFSVLPREKQNIDYLMREIAGLLPEKYQGVYGDEPNEI